MTDEQAYAEWLKSSQFKDITDDVKRAFEEQGNDAVKD
jgi:hypothetical protein